MENKKYSQYFSDSAFWKKIKKVGKRAGLLPICYALALYYVLIKDKTSYTDKAMILSALGYFILPIDIIPDFLLPSGYTDDLGLLVITLKKIQDNIDDDIINNIHTILIKWFDIEHLEIKKIVLKDK